MITMRSCTIIFFQCQSNILLHVFVLVLAEDFSRRFSVQKEFANLFDILARDACAPVYFGRQSSRGQQLNRVPVTIIQSIIDSANRISGSNSIPKGGAIAYISESNQSVVFDGQSLCLCADADNLHHLLGRVLERPQDEKPVEKVQRDSVWRHNVIRSSDGAHTAVGCKDDDGSDGRLQGPLQVRETLHVQHVHLVDEEDARNKFRNPLVNVLVDHFVNLAAQFVCTQ